MKKLAYCLLPTAYCLLACLVCLALHVRTARAQEPTPTRPDLFAAPTPTATPQPTATSSDQQPAAIIIRPTSVPWQQPPAAQPTPLTFIIRILNLAPWLPAIIAAAVILALTGLRRVALILADIPRRWRAYATAAAFAALVGLVLYQAYALEFKPSSTDLRTAEAQLANCHDPVCRQFVRSVVPGSIIFYWTGDPISAIISAGQFTPGDLTFPPSHVGIAVDDGIIISAAQHGVEYHSAAQILTEYHVKPATAIIPLTDAQRATMINWTRNHLGKWYNFAGLLIGLPGRDTWYCSDFVVDALAAAGVNVQLPPRDLPHISPRDLMSASYDGQPLAWTFIPPANWQPFNARANLNTLTANTIFQISLSLLIATTMAAASRAILNYRHRPLAASIEAAKQASLTITETDAAPPSPPGREAGSEGDPPILFMANGARILITGPSRSGKSTVLHQLIHRALTDPSFDKILIFDGKGPELITWSKCLPNIIYAGPNDFDEWIAPLESAANDITDRYAALVQQGLRKAPAGSRRRLIIIDEVQKATRSSAGKKITKALLTLTEQSGALNDVIILTTQRAVHQSLNKTISYNCNLFISMRGPSYPGRFDVYDSPEATRPIRSSQAAPARDELIASWAAEIETTFAPFQALQPSAQPATSRTAQQQVNHASSHP